MYTVGQFSVICGVSIKALHHYDEIRLLKPLHTDSVTGYRYYDYEQIKNGVKKEYLQVSYSQDLL
ncbi:MerR family DNA-binding transcriptional regulator [Bacillus sp. DX4.1]|uniref:MerR family DNA-binding transcriptional regulator n=1 Tax=Bacillus sp. DX4.1 TaxID=3055867 RepID=UPI0025A10064|nr:MerR family DNA-binding transcriptional regulator [Bacillus sp. DX4.1]MDM5186209.1 MerR family DNA-binding transcriptional regulator [Bacillus sp. DX4.1]